jgi:hypothetical protein
MKRKEEAAIETSGGDAGDRGPVDQSPAMRETQGLSEDFILPLKK